MNGDLPYKIAVKREISVGSVAVVQLYIIVEKGDVSSKINLKPLLLFEIPHYLSTNTQKYSWRRDISTISSRVALFSLVRLDRSHTVYACKKFNYLPYPL